MAAQDSAEFPVVPLPQKGDSGAYEHATIVRDGAGWETAEAVVWQFLWLGDATRLDEAGAHASRQEALVRQPSGSTFVQSHDLTGALRSVILDQGESGMRAELDPDQADGVEPLCLLRHGFQSPQQRSLADCQTLPESVRGTQFQATWQTQRGGSTVTLLQSADDPERVQAWLSSTSAYPLAILHRVTPDIYERWQLLDMRPDASVPALGPMGVPTDAPGPIPLAMRTGWSLPDQGLRIPFQLGHAFESAVGHNDRDNRLADFLWDHPYAYVVAAQYGHEALTEGTVAAMPIGSRPVQLHHWSFNVTDGVEIIQVQVGRHIVNGESTSLPDAASYSNVTALSSPLPWREGVPSRWPTADGVLERLASRAGDKSIESIQFSLHCGESCFDGRLRLQLETADASSRAWLTVDEAGRELAFATTVEQEPLADEVVWDSQGAFLVQPVEPVPAESSGGSESMPAFAWSILLAPMALAVLSVLLWRRDRRKRR